MGRQGKMGFLDPLGKLQMSPSWCQPAGIPWVWTATLTVPEPVTEKVWLWGWGWGGCGAVSPPLICYHLKPSGGREAICSTLQFCDHTHSLEMLISCIGGISLLRRVKKIFAVFFAFPPLILYKKVFVVSVNCRISESVLGFNILPHNLPLLRGNAVAWGGFSFLPWSNSPDNLWAHVSKGRKGGREEEMAQVLHGVILLTQTVQPTQPWCRGRWMRGSPNSWQDLLRTVHIQDRKPENIFFFRIFPCFFFLFFPLVNKQKKEKIRLFKTRESEEKQDGNP